MEQKIEDEEFLGDTAMLLRSDEKYNPVEAWEFVRNQLIEKLQCKQYVGIMTPDFDNASP